MPLRITIELIPRGDESRKRKLAVVNVENDGTAGDGRGNGEVGNYRVEAAGDCGAAGWDDFAAFTIGPLTRGNYIDTCAEVMTALHSAHCPPQGSRLERCGSGDGEHTSKTNPLAGVASINLVIP